MNTVQPIRDKRKIKAMKDLLKSRDEKYYIMFLIGINIGLRVSDILTLKAEDVNGKTHVTLTEEKTGKKKRFLINENMQKELDSYLKKHGLKDGDYLIRSNKGVNRPVSRVQAYRVLRDAADSIGLEEIGTHTMRKTFGYWHYQQFHDVALLQDMFNHSSPGITLRYIGINDDMKDQAMKKFFL
jgi:integrase